MVNRGKKEYKMEKKNIDWGNIGFGYIPTDYRYVSNYKDGKWDDGQLTQDPNIVLNECAGVLQYAQTVFEGLKAYTTEDGHIVTFRPDLNGERLESSAARLEMPIFPKERFVEAVTETVKANDAFVPPYGSGATLYIRPYMFGSNPVIGVKPADEYQFRILCTPVGPYFKAGFKPTKVMLERRYDRAAPNGTGHIKVGGNYAAGMRSGEVAHQKGYSTAIFLDSKEKKYIDECGPANFFGIKDNTYITPKSSSILPSITNKSLMQLAEDMGIKVERRPIPEEELETFEEAGACGTAAVISPIQRIDDLENGKSYVISKDGKPGPICTKLYNKLRGIQYGDEPDTHGWVTIVE